MERCYGKYAYSGAGTPPIELEWVLIGFPDILGNGWGYTVGVFAFEVANLWNRVFKPSDINRTPYGFKDWYGLGQDSTVYLSPRNVLSVARAAGAKVRPLTAGEMFPTETDRFRFFAQLPEAEY